MRAAGIDVSHHHPVTDWDALLATDVSFIGIKATQGAHFVDPWLARHKQEARARADRLALVVYYHYPEPGDPVAQAQRLLYLLADVDEGPLHPNERVALDVEERRHPDGTVDPPPDVVWIDAFYRALPQDRRHLIYTSDRVWQTIGSPAWARAADVDLWAPRYKSGLEEPVVPAPWSSWTFWQWSEAAAIPGVDGPCDADYFRGDAAELRAYAALAAPGA
jgi:lysozyme